MAKVPGPIPVMRPRLPTAELLLPYLRRIDEKRWYSNFGPLVCELEARLAAHLGVGPGAVATIANGTLALVVALQALTPRPGSVCILPSWTFVGSVAAVKAAGLEPHFADVDPLTWALDPDRLSGRLDMRVGDVGAVLAVAPFGAPFERAAWDRFTARTGVPVVIDAAAGFDAVATVTAAGAGETPIMISLHATKALGAGEGAVLLSTRQELIARCRRISNFGFTPAREVTLVGINAKMSEYAAAVALAALDLWPETRAAWRAVAMGYRARFGESRLLFAPVAGDWISSYCIALFPNGAERAARKLGLAGIETRRWWGDGCHRYAAYADCARDPLPVTERLGATALGLPCFVDLADDEIAAVVREAELAARPRRLTAS